MEVPKEPPKNLEELKAITGDQEQIDAATAYLEKVEKARKDALHVRDQAIRRLTAAHGPSEAARRANLSLSTIKAITRTTS